MGGGPPLGRCLGGVVPNRDHVSDHLRESSRDHERLRWRRIYIEVTAHDRKPEVGERVHTALRTISQSNCITSHTETAFEGELYRVVATRVVVIAIGGSRVRVHEWHASAMEVARCAYVLISAEYKDGATWPELGDELRRSAGGGEGDNQLRLVVGGGVDDGVGHGLVRVKRWNKHLVEVGGDLLVKEGRLRLLCT